MDLLHGPQMIEAVSKAALRPRIPGYSMQHLESTHILLAGQVMFVVMTPVYLETACFCWQVVDPELSSWCS